MRLYETTFLINPQTDDATIDNHVQSVKDVIADQGGKIVLDNRMGTRRLAYEVDGLTQAYYTNLIFEAPAQALSPLERHFRLGEAYLRNLTVLFEGDVEDMVSRARETAAATAQPQVTTEAEERKSEGRREEAVGAEERAPAEQPAEEPAEEPKYVVETVAEPAEAGELDEETEEALQPTEPEGEPVPGSVETKTEEVEEQVRQEAGEPEGTPSTEEPGEPEEAQPAAKAESVEEEEPKKPGVEGEPTEEPPETRYDEEEQL